MRVKDLPDELIQKLVNAHRQLNDAHRQSTDGALGEDNVGGAAADLPIGHLNKVRQAVRETEQFDDEMHSSGHVDFDGQTYRWEIRRYTDKSKREFCDGRLLGYRELIFAFPEDFIHKPPK